jgi:hypothetical protein
VETGALDGIGHREDSRNVLAEDLDGDGRVDLLVSTYELWPKFRQRLRIHRNQSKSPFHWIGFRLPAAGLNARVRIQTASGPQTRWLITGDGYRTQSSFSAHFGLGTREQVSAVEILWPDGTRSTLANPAIDSWHRIQK